jgi:cobalt-zinc-cadmium efflux system outer membrane protein
MARIVKISLIVFVIVSIHTICADAESVPLQERIVRPVGAPTRPILLKPSISKEALSRFPALPITNWITFSNFMVQVEKANLYLAMQRYNVPIAQAQLTAASVFPDPTLQAGYSGDASWSGQPSTYSAALAQEFVLGGKRHYREDAARAVLLGSSATLSDYLRNLRAVAAETFIDGLADILKLNQMEKSLERAHQLVELNVERLRQGETSEDALMRARIAELEAHSALADVESALYQTLAQLALLMGISDRDGLIAPKGDLEGVTQTFSLAQLVERAVTSRSDVVAAEYTLRNAQAGYQLAKAARIPDVTITAGYSHLTRITNPIDPAPAWEQAGISVSLPITVFSTLNGGAVQVAYYQELQAERALRGTKLQAESDVRRAYQHYILAVNEAQSFGSELLNDSSEIYQSRLFKLRKGQVTMLDVLDAYQALTQLYLDYYNALSGRAKALAELEQAAGIWDIDF